MVEDDVVADFEQKLSKLKEIFNNYVEIEKTHRQPENFLSILNYKRNPNTTSKETSYQYCLKYFLDPNQAHGFEAEVLRSFLNLIDKSQFSIDYVKIDKEVPMVEGSEEADDLEWDSPKRIDLVIANYEKPSDFDSTPDWIIFIELKVASPENENQTQNYVEAQKCRPSRLTDEIDIQDIDEADKEYLYIKKSEKDGPAEDSKTFVPIDWKEVAKQFEEDLQHKLLGLPHRSVVQFTDFIDSLKGEENMEKASETEEEKEMNEMLQLYLENKKLIGEDLNNLENKVDQMQDEFIKNIENNWVQKVDNHYNLKQNSKFEKKEDDEKPNWLAVGNQTRGRIYPISWKQDLPKNDIGGSSLHVSFLHMIDKESIFETVEKDKLGLKFGLQLPQSRNKHTSKEVNNKNFNEEFIEQCESNLAEKFRIPNDVEEKYEGADLIFFRQYETNISKSDELEKVYYDMLFDAIDEFCCNEDLIEKLDCIFRNIFNDFYGGNHKEPEKVTSLKSKN